jgi:hypothetical protein
MKKRTTFLLAVLGGFIGAILIDLFGFVKANAEQHNYYANTAVVTEVDKANNLVTVEDCNGNTWQFTETEDWEFADTCSMLMDNKGTQNVSDDEIIQITYCSFEVF